MQSWLDWGATLRKNDLACDDACKALEKEFGLFAEPRKRRFKDLGKDFCEIVTWLPKSDPSRGSWSCSSGPCESWEQARQKVAESNTLLILELMGHPHA